MGVSHVNRTTARLGLAAAATVAVLLSPLAQTAASAEPKTPTPAAGQLTVKPGDRPLPAAAPLGPSGDAPIQASRAIRRPPVVPDAEGDECLRGDGAQTTLEGRTHNRFVWCRRAIFTGDVYDQDLRWVGGAEFVYRTIAYGRDDGDRSIKVFLRAEPGTLKLSGPDRATVETAIFGVWTSCKSPIDGCSSGGAPVANTFRGWNDDGTWHSWTVASDDSAGFGPDVVRRHDWAFTISVFSPVALNVPPLTLSYRTIRCDSATAGFPRSRSKACVFDSVIPHLQYSKQSARVGEVARHIECAVDLNCRTYPVKDTAKTVPGKYYGNRQAAGLHRIQEQFPVDPATTKPYYKANSDQKTAACTQSAPYLAKGLPPSLYDPAVQQCDEFPFASTYEGAGRGDWNFSVLGVTSRVNSCAGYDLGRYYRDDRILVWRPGIVEEAEDKFYVEITDTPDNSTDECDAPDDPAPPPNVAPTVNAGPDRFGEEGLVLLLSGAVTDPDNVPDVHWTYSVGLDTDPGASCTFGSPEAAVTSVVCTDDGTFTVTLTANDGVNGSVRDSAQLHLTNVAPQVQRRGGPNLAGSPRPASADGESGITAPRPWQLYRVGDPVTLTAKFTDPGSNDSHTCSVAWDDGTTSAVQPAGRVCQATHAFAHAGMYTVKPTITDDDGGVDGDSVLVVVYDPKAGVPSGNGWLDAPGQGGFDFTASYATAASTIPDGAVTFALPPAANLNLRNHQHLDWLVVTPDGKIAIKGTAERIPGQSVGFVLYGYYGCPAGGAGGCQPGSHRLRMVVWDSTADGPIPEGVPAIYDNRAGRSFDVDLAQPQPIAQGAILILHPPVQ